MEFRLRLVERDIGKFLRCSQVYYGLFGRVVAPGAHGVEIVHKRSRKVGGHGLTTELRGEVVCEVLVHDDPDEQGVAGGPELRIVTKDAEFQRKVFALNGNRCVDATGVDLQVMQLVFGNRGDGPVGAGAKLQGSLETVVLKEGWTEDLGEFAGSVAAEDIHLEEAILGGDEALCEGQIVEGGGTNVGNAVGIALNGDGSGKPGDRKGSIDLRERAYQHMVDIASRSKERGQAQDEQDGYGNGEKFRTTVCMGVAAPAALDQGWLIMGLRKTHLVMQSLNAGGVGTRRGHLPARHG